MCGIFGYIGKRNDAAKVVFEGLKRLEYRGYDSWGIVAKQETRNRKQETGDLIIEKHVGKISDSSLNSKLLTLSSRLAIGHTRWATHVGVTVANAHPHLDCSGKLALVHNGIVENYQKLRKSLGKKGHKFKSETDTEVVVHLVEEYAKRQSLKEAVRSAFQDITGLNAFVFISDKDQIFAVKSATPLVIGIGNGDNFISSDPNALLSYTKKAILLGDSQLAEISADNVRITSLVTRKKIKPKVLNIDWKAEEIELGRFKHFMLKEIYEQPQILRNIAQNYTQQINQLCKIIRQAHGIFLIGAGSAFHACLAGSYLFSKIAKEHVNTIVASEFNYLEDFLTKDSLIIALSQSGETIDIIEPLKRAKEKGSKIVAIVNNQGSTIWQMADYKMLLGAGPEIAVASTKAYIAKLAILLLIVNGLIGKLENSQSLLMEAAAEVERLLNEENSTIEKISRELAKHEHIFTLGRGLSFQSALEAALKMKEVSYIHTEGLAGGELKHGPIALISEGTPCVVFAPLDETYEAIISNAAEIKSRGGLIIGIGPIQESVFERWIKVKDLGVASIIANVIPAQLFGYYLALERKLDPDKPRNLAKSVTVK